MRPVLGGRSFFDVQKEVGLKIQNEIEDLCQLEHGALITFIKEKLLRGRSSDILDITTKID